MKVVSLNIGEKRIVVWKGKNIETGIFKSPVKGPLFLGKEDVDQDNVVDRRVHGGVEKAVYGFSIEHYEYFKSLHPKLDWQLGMFGENLTFSKLNEDQINVGDIYLLGETTLQATKPRQPCFKLGIRFEDPIIIKQFRNTTKSGVYFKVLKTGFVGMNDKLILVEKSNNTPTIKEVLISKNSNLTYN